MAVTNHQTVLQKLKKQVKELKRREELGRRQLHAALQKAERLGKVYKNKLASKVRLMQAKLVGKETQAYSKVAKEIEKKLLKNLAAKAKAIAAAVAGIEKKHAVKLKNSVVKKARRVAKVSKRPRRGA